MKPKPKPTQSKRQKQHPAIDGFRCSQAQFRACLKMTKRRKLAKAIADMLFRGCLEKNDCRGVLQRLEQLLKKHGI